MSAGNNVCYACCVSYFVSAPCHGTTLHPATKGGKWEGLFNNSQPTLAEVDEELLRGVKGFGEWVSLLYQNISSNIYIYTYTKSYKNISSYIDITHIYIYRDHDQSLQHTRQTNTDTHPHKHTKKKRKKTSGPISAPVRGLPANIWLL